MSDSSVLYVFVAQLFIGLMLTGIFYTVWASVDRRPHALTWCLAFGVATLNAVVNAINPLFTSREIYWVVVTSLSLTSASLAYVGFRQRALLPVRTRRIVAIVVGLELLIVWFTMVQPHVGIRMVVTPWYSTVVFLLSARILLGGRRPIRPAATGTVVLLVVYALTQFVSAGAALLQGAQWDERLLVLYRQINLLTQPACQAGLGLFAMLLIADDLSARMRSLALTDSLTGAINRRGLMDAGDRELARSRRMARPLAVLLVDLDHFKELNDRHGHACGDRALQAFVGSARRELRAGDTLGRLGGEEFAILLPGVSLDEARAIAERVRRRTRDIDLTESGEPVVLSVSIGVALTDSADGSLESALARADEALYRAKEGGRDRVETAVAPR